MKRDSFNDGEWTAARFRSFVTGALRTATRRWPPKYKALKEAFTGRQVNAKTGKLYCEANNLQVLCKPCHAVKTAEEKKLRKKK